MARVSVSINCPKGHFVTTVSNDSGANAVKSGGVHCKECKKGVSYNLRGQNIVSVNFN